MSLWDDICRYFYRSALEQRISSPADRRVINLTDAQSIGILYDTTLPANDAVIQKYADQLRNMGKTVNILAFLRDKKIDSKGSLKIFNLKGVNWYNVPVDDGALAFAQQRFDILLCAITSESLPLEYLTAISKAKYRLGPFLESKTSNFDLMIQSDEKKDLNYLLEQMLSVLNKLKY